MYVYMNAADQAVNELLATCYPNLDKRIVNYLKGPVRTALKKDTYRMREAMISSYTKYDPNKGIQVVAWKDAPEAMKAALMNGEPLRALNPRDTVQLVTQCLKHMLLKVKLDKRAKVLESLDGYSPTALRTEYNEYIDRTRAKRQAREALRGEVVLHVHRVAHNHVVEMVQLFNEAALGLVGKALKNCLRENYKTKSKYTARSGYIGFRHVVDGVAKWTSLGEHNLIHIHKDAGFKSRDHLAFRNEDESMPDIDSELWDRAQRHEFDALIEANQRTFDQRKADRMTIVTRIVSPLRVATKMGLERYLFSGQEIGRGTRSVVTTFDRLYGAEFGRDEFRDMTVTVERSMAGTFREFLELSDLERTVTGRLLPTRLYHGVGRNLAAEENARQRDVARHRQGQFGTMYGAQLIYGQMAPTREETESDDQRRLRTNNIANPLSRRTTNQLETRQAQRNLRQATVSPLLSRLAGAVTPKPKQNSWFNR